METLQDRQHETQHETHQPVSIMAKLPVALLCGIGAALATGIGFGLLSLITILMEVTGGSVLLGMVGSLFAGIAIATALLSPFKRVDRPFALKMFPISFVLTLFCTVLIVLIPFMGVTLRADPDASLITVLNVAWKFYRMYLTQFGSSLIITAIGVLSGFLGYFGRLNGLRRKGVYRYT